MNKYIMNMRKDFLLFENNQQHSEAVLLIPSNVLPHEGFPQGPMWAFSVILHTFYDSLPFLFLLAL